jgi:nitrogen regulatory protein PII
MLKLVQCVTDLSDLENIVNSVIAIGVGVTVYNTRQSNPATDRRVTYRGCAYECQASGVVVEIITDDSWLDDIITTITKADNDTLISGRTIQVFPIQECYRICDGFMDTR